MTDDIKRFERDADQITIYHNAWRERLAIVKPIVYTWAGINSDEMMPDWIKEANYQMIASACSITPLPQRG